MAASSGIVEFQTNSKASVEVKIADGSTPKHTKADEFGYIAAKSVMVSGGGGEFQSVMEPLESDKKKGRGDQQQLVTPPSRQKPPVKPPERHYKTDKPGINKMKIAFTKRRFSSDLSLFFALAGIVLMIVYNELVWSKQFPLVSYSYTGIYHC